MKKTLGIITAGFCASALTSQAVVLVSYQFNDPADYNIISGDSNSARVTWNATTTADDTSSTIYQGVGLQLFANGGLNTAFTSTAEDATLRANAGDSQTFTISANPGFLLDLGSLTFDVPNNANNGNTFSVDVIADGGTASTILATTNSTTSPNLDLTGFGNVSELEVRINIDSYSSGNLQFDNVIVNGDVVAVPEPGSVALLGLGGLALMLRRRK